MKQLAGLLQGQAQPQIGNQQQVPQTNNMGSQRQPQTQIPSQAQTPQVNSDPKQQGKLNRQLSMFMVNGLKVLSDKKYIKKILNVIKTGLHKPLHTIADVLLGIVISMVTDARKKGLALDNGIIAHGTNLLLGHFLQLLEAAGMKPLTDEEKLAVYQMVVAQYLDTAVKMGLMTKEELMQISEQMKQTPQGQKVMQQKDEGQPGQPQPRQPQPGQSQTGQTPLQAGQPGQTGQQGQMLSKGLLNRGVM